MLSEHHRVELEDKIQISLHRKKYSLKTCDFLCATLDETEDEELLILMPTGMPHACKLIFSFIKVHTQEK